MAEVSKKRVAEVIHVKHRVNVYKKFDAMRCTQKQAVSDDVLFGFMFQWDFLVIVDMTEQRSVQSNMVVAVMSQSCGRA